ncbi:MAG: hypothetical protein E6K97_09925 [Thaumarchaeota archaeon]|nr:MAG: hypothetical protein E6K97_09925 [Nitrososphaerota archaeon]
MNRDGVINDHRFIRQTRQQRPTISNMRKRCYQPDIQICKSEQDAATPEFITTLKELVGETTRWEYIHDKMLYCKKHNLDLARYINVIPVPFSTSAKDMLIILKSC